jgi:ATP-binding cassette subfamily B (MDR/TAP) protein 1
LLNRVLLKIAFRNTDALFNVINFRFGEFVGNFAKIIGCIAFAFASSWQSAIVYLPFFIVLLIVSPLIFKKIQVQANKEKTAYESAYKFVQEALDSIRTVASFGLEKVFISKHTKLLEEAKKLSIENGLISSTVEEISINICILLHGFSIAFLISFAEKRCQKQSYVDLIRTFFAILFACFNIIHLIFFSKQLIETNRSTKEMFNILEEKTNSSVNQDPYNNDTKRDSNIFDNASTSITKTIEFENVYFKYPNRLNINILKGLNLEIKFGSTVAFVGARFDTFKNKP